MYRRLLNAIPLVPAILLGGAVVRAQNIDYPETRADGPTETIHGEQVADPYRWLEGVDDPEVAAWTEKQNSLTRFLLDRFSSERAAIAGELRELYALPSVSTPTIAGERYFYTRREGDQNQPIVYVKEGSYGAPARVAIDPNAFSEDGTVALDWWFPSPDGSLIAYGRSEGGSEKSTLYVRDVTTGKDLEDAIPYTRASDVAWDADGKGFHYIRYPIPGTVPAGDDNYFRRVHYHKLGTDWKQDPKLFADDRPKEEWFSISNSTDDRYQFLYRSVDWSKNDLFIRRTGDADFTPIAVDLEGQFSGDLLGDTLYLLTDYGAPRYHVMVTDADKPGEEHWKELIPQHKGVIRGMTIAGGKLVLNMLEDAHSRLLIFDADGKLEREIELPTMGSVNGVSGHPERPELFYGFQSFAYPPVIVRYDVNSHASELVEQATLKRDLSHYVTRQVWFNSKDGTRVPMFVVHRDDVKLDGQNPTILYGYGGFDVSITPGFWNSMFPWLDRGGVYAVANLRGGGEFGKEWHLAGRLGQKQNVFDDMIAAAEKLIADKYTNPKRLAARGGSNGGLLMGAMMTQRPDLFGAIHCAVPLLDMLRYQNFSIARLWIPEYGSADDAEQFQWLRAYSPYHNAKRGAKYPAILFTTAESDSRVDPMHARKMAALLQAYSTSGKPILLWVETKAGHGAGKPVSKRIDSDVDYLIFFMSQLGMLDGEA